ncbi:MAG: hypothetical protein GY943_24135 [Chloroflexi bacterium]|nr:hypothetical protein [Chloroflexota bacterium]
MSPDARPLWQLLVDVVSEKRPLSCPECFSVLEYLAEIIPRDEQGFDPTFLAEALSEHLSTCPKCNHYYRQKLAELVAFQQITEGQDNS